VLQPQ